MELGRAIFNESKDKVLNKNRCILLLKFVEDTNGSNSFLIIVLRSVGSNIDDIYYNIGP